MKHTHRDTYTAVVSCAVLLLLPLLHISLRLLLLLLILMLPLLRVQHHYSCDYRTAFSLKAEQKCEAA